MLASCPMFPLITTGAAAFERGFGSRRGQGSALWVRCDNRASQARFATSGNRRTSPHVADQPVAVEALLVASPNQAMRTIQVGRNIAGGVHSVIGIRSKIRRPPECKRSAAGRPSIADAALSCSQLELTNFLRAP